MPAPKLDWPTLRDLIDRAAGLPEEERERFLETSCEDSTARSWIKTLLDPSGAGPPPLERAGEDAPVAGRRLGPYRLLREIDRGGMGVVYLAERDDGEYQQRVAIKVVSRGPLSTELRARFLTERQVLARLAHRHIARLLDGGTTPEDVPYLVMEYIEGEKITEYCERRAVSLEGRLRLLADVCRGIDFAHRNLIVHRDLKPGNILVTAEGTAKVLDFGIAKLLDPAVDDDLTRAHQMPGTLGYASPEQLVGEPVTTASDVYSLGVVLFELLTGRLPFERETDSFKAVARILREEEPLSPSQALRGSGGAVPVWRRWLPPSAGAPRPLEGDLDRIVLKAIERDPARRYGNAAELGADLGRYLRREPVSATPPSLFYLAGRFARRRRGTVVAALLVVLSLLGGLIARSLEARRANQAREVAELERRRAEQLATSMLTDLGRRLDTIDRMDILDPTAEAVETYYRQRAVEAPQLESLERQVQALEMVGFIKIAVGQPEKALEAGRQRLEILRRIEPQRPPRQAVLEQSEARLDLAEALQENLRQDEALEQLEAILSSIAPWIERHPDDVELAVLRVNGLDASGVVHFDQGRLETAKALFEQAAAWLDRPPHSSRASAEIADLKGVVLLHWGVTLSDLGQPELAQGPLERTVALAEREQQAHPDSPEFLIHLSLARVVLAHSLLLLEQPDGALALLHETEPSVRRAVDMDPGNAELRYQLTQILLEAADAHRALGETGEAERALLQTLEVSAPMIETQHLYLRDAHVRALFALGRSPEAAEMAGALLAEGWNHRGFRDLCAEHGIER